MQEIKRIKKLSLAKIVALAWALLAFIISFGFFIYSLVKIILEKNITSRLAYFIAVNLGLAFLSSLVVAIIAAAIGWLIGLLVSSWYNFIAREIGGVKIELAEEESETEEVIIIEKKQELFKY
ncbi:MAG TPA: hypothetical protein VMD74_04645 [Candidatus Methylomirabilis sp.]|nr:hypothetical protein [Candidatus Methylomirabilis sp.]